MAKCKTCGAAIKWEQTNHGKWRPVDLNGYSHFQTCGTHRKKLSPALVIDGKEIVGRNYKASGCDCNVPPWDVCPHSFPIHNTISYDPAEEYRQRMLIG